MSNEIITGSLPVRDFHGRRPVLCSATMPPVCRFTEFQNSSSPSCFDASPSASKVSNSSWVPAKPGTVRCSTAVKAASDHFLERSVTATAYHRLNSPLLLHCEMNRHTLNPSPLPCRVKRVVFETWPSRLLVFSHKYGTINACARPSTFRTLSIGASRPAPLAKAVRPRN